MRDGESFFEQKQHWGGGDTPTKKKETEMPLQVYYAQDYRFEVLTLFALDFLVLVLCCGGVFFTSL